MQTASTHFTQKTVIKFIVVDVVKRTRTKWLGKAMKYRNQTVKNEVLILATLRSQPEHSIQFEQKNLYSTD